MKHIFYLIYVLSFSGAVFVSGMFIGQFLERVWSRREAREKLETNDAQVSPMEDKLCDVGIAKIARGE